MESKTKAKTGTASTKTRKPRKKSSEKSQSKKTRLKAVKSTDDMDSPLEQGLAFKKERDKGTSVKDIAVLYNVSIPAIYKYIKLADIDPKIQDYIRKDEIPSSEVINIIDNYEPKEVLDKVEEEIEKRQKKETKMKAQGMSKMTLNRRLISLREELGSRNLTTSKAKLVSDFADQLKSGESVENIVEMVVRESKEEEKVDFVKERFDELSNEIKNNNLKTPRAQLIMSLYQELNKENTSTAKLLKMVK